jgi:hypothetical protein
MNGIRYLFITRMKDNAVFEVMKERKVPLYWNILTDQLIAFAERGL